MPLHHPPVPLTALRSGHYGAVDVLLPIAMTAALLGAVFAASQAGGVLPTAAAGPASGQRTGEGAVEPAAAGDIEGDIAGDARGAQRSFAYVRERPPHVRVRTRGARVTCLLLPEVPARLGDVPA